MDIKVGLFFILELFLMVMREENITAIVRQQYFMNLKRIIREQMGNIHTYILIPKIQEERILINLGLME